MRASFGLPSVESEEVEGKPPIQVYFYLKVLFLWIEYAKISETFTEDGLMSLLSSVVILGSSDF